MQVHIIYFLVGFLFTIIFAWILLSQRQKELNRVCNENKQLNQELTLKHEQVVNLTRNLASAESRLEVLSTSFEAQKQETINLKHQVSIEFENLANKIFEEKSSKFNEQNRLALSALLNPLGEKIKVFESRVEEIYGTDIRERATLKEQIANLTKLNQQMTKETQNLTLALKGDTKTQGNWGEMILESILEKSGLVKGREYKLQEHIMDDLGKAYRPDVLIQLPENKVLIIDAKVSLTAYERYIASIDEEEKNKAYKEHILSIKNHIKGLGDKEYQKLWANNTLDFILLFIPIESAFALAMQFDSSLFDEAINKNIVIVCPSTLLATMRTVASIWRVVWATNNAQEIATLGGELYDRFINFLNVMDKIKDSIIATQNRYDEALTKLNGNRGVIKSAIKLKDLGAKSTKIISDKWVLDNEKN